MYEQQDDKQVEHNLRGKFITDDQGRYSFYCLRPTPYPVSDKFPVYYPHSKAYSLQGPRGWPRRQAPSPLGPPRVPSCSLAFHGKPNSDLTNRTRSNTPQVIAKDHKSVVTQIFDSDSSYLDNDSVFAVKDGLTVDFKPRKGDSQAEWELEYNMSLATESRYLKLFFLIVIAELYWTFS